MAGIDVKDAALIGAPPRTVFDAIMTLMAGKAEWWEPHLRVRAQGDRTPSGVGSLSEIEIPGRARFVARIEEATPPSRLGVRYISGDFDGVGRWTFEPEGHGTRICLHWQVVPTRWSLRLLKPLVARGHSQVMQIGFRALDQHLKTASLAAAS